MSSFADIVEDVKALSTQEKQELHELIEKYLIGERREEIYQNYICSLSELGDGKTEFSSDTGKLKGQLLND
jgi:hypothetical protein